MLVGWLGTPEPVINAHTTAEVYLYFATFAYMLPDPTSRAEVINSIHSLPGLSSVEDAISSALVAHPTLSPSADPGVKSSLVALAVALGGSNVTAMLRARGGSAPVTKSDGRFHPAVTGVSPGNTLSGITIVTGDADTFHFMNTFRRQAAAFVDETSHVDATTGKPVTDQAPDTNPPTDIAAVAGIGSFLGAISDYLRGAYALVPSNGEEIPTPNIAGAKSTTYRIAVVGPGVALGDFGSLTEVEQDKQVEETVETLIYEVTLPLIAAILVPTAKISTELKGAANAAIKDVLTTLASDARVKAAARSGDAKAVFDIISADLVQSTLLTEKLTEGAVELLGLAGKDAAPDAAAEIAEKLTLPIEIVDGGIAVFDYAGVAADTTAANKGDLFMITTTNAATTFLPATSNIAASGTLTLTAAVHPPPTDLVVYKYTNTATYGHLTPGGLQVHEHSDVRALD